MPGIPAEYLNDGKTMPEGRISKALNEKWFMAKATASTIAIGAMSLAYINHWLAPPGSHPLVEHLTFVTSTPMAGVLAWMWADWLTLLDKKTAMHPEIRAFLDSMRSVSRGMGGEVRHCERWYRINQLCAAGLVLLGLPWFAFVFYIGYLGHWPSWWWALLAPIVILITLSAYAAAQWAGTYEAIQEYSDRRTFMLALHAAK